MADLEWDLDDVVEVLDAAIGEGLHDAGHVLLRESNALSPDDTGEMDRSGEVVVDGNQAGVGYTSEYAWKQHEKLYYRHDGGGQPKFLEEALVGNVDQIAQAMAEPLRRALR